MLLAWGGALRLPVADELDDLWRAAADALAPDAPAPVLAVLREVGRRGRLRAATTGRSSRLMDLLREAEEELGLDVAEAVLEHARDAPLDAWTPSIRHDPDAPDALRALRAQGLAIGMATDTAWPRALCERFLARDGLDGLIDARAYSAEGDHVKPDPAPLLLLAERLGVPPSACVHVGARPEADVEGARAAGMRAVWLDRRHSGETSGADAVVGGLASLPAAVDGLGPTPTG